MDEGIAEQHSEGIDNLRKALDERTKALKELQVKYRTLQAQVAFKDANLNPKHADLFLRVHPEDEDITADAVKRFAKDFDLPTVAAETPKQEGATAQPEGQPKEPNPEAALAGMAGAGTTAVGQNPPSSPGQKLSMAEFAKLLQTDRAAALQAYTEGRVEHSEGNVFVEQAKRAGLIE